MNRYFRRGKISICVVYLCLPSFVCVCGQDVEAVRIYFLGAGFTHAYHHVFSAHPSLCLRCASHLSNEAVITVEGSQFVFT